MDTKRTLTELRQEIDAVDTDMIKLLAKRQLLVNEVLALKKVANLPARIPARIDAVVNNAAQQAKLVGLDPDLARTVWSAMVEWFVLHEEQQLRQG